MRIGRLDDDVILLLGQTVTTTRMLLCFPFIYFKMLPASLANKSPDSKDSGRSSEITSRANGLLDKSCFL